VSWIPSHARTPANSTPEDFPRDHIHLDLPILKTTLADSIAADYYGGSCSTGQDKKRLEQVFWGDDPWRRTTYSAKRYAGS
jgi:hypothetical protein